MAEILLIDDDLELGALVRKVLEERGHRLDLAPSCREAEERLEAQRYDLLIVDGLLPDGRGTDVLEKLKKTGKPVNAMFISSSWHEVTEVAARSSELGVARVLRKPIDPATFSLEVSYALGPNRPAERQAEGAELLEAAIAQFRTRLVERVHAFEAALHVARKSGDPALLVPIHAEAHKLHGTAGSFGYDQVSVAADAIETIVGKALPSRSALDEEQWRRIAAASERMQAALADSPRPSNAPSASTRASVLIVEDDALLLRSLATDLSASIEVLTACTAESALEIARTAQPTCVVIDVHLGDRLQGFELAKALRAQPGSDRVPIVFMSADSSLDTQITGLHVGGSLFLNKPLTAGPLLDAVRRLTEVQNSARPRVVMLDDDSLFCAAVQRILSRTNVVFQAVQDESDLLDTLATEEPALLLLDVRLNNISGLDICRTLRANPRWEDLDIVLVTAETSVEMRIAAFRAGATDYVSKPIVAEELVARVMSRIERRALRDERTTRDNLTGLLMRGPFAEAFERMLKLTRRNEGQLSLCLLDLDRFKAINDRYGHVTGDRVLSSLGQLLNRRFRGEDLRCRWGGEEIVIVLSGSPRTEATLALERLLAEFQSLTFDDGTHAPFHATFSAGVASYPEEGRTLDELIALADARMYASKRQGRARIIAQ